MNEIDLNKLFEFRKREKELYFQKSDEEKLERIKELREIREKRLADVMFYKEHGIMSHFLILMRNNFAILKRLRTAHLSASFKVF